MSEVDAALRSLSALKSGPRRRPLRPLETNLSSRFRPSLPGPRRHLLRPLETKTSPCFQPSGAEEASTTPPLRRTSRLGFDSPCRAEEAPTSRLDFGPPCRGQGGVHYALLRRTSRLGFGSPCWDRGGVHYAPLRRTSRLGFGSACWGRGGDHSTPLRRTSRLVFPSLGSPAVGACCLVISV